MRALIGYAHLSVRGWRDVTFLLLYSKGVGIGDRALES